MPSGGWVYTQSSTGTTIQARTWNELLRRVSNYRLANGIPLDPEFEESIGREICIQQGWESPVCMDDMPPPVLKRQLGVMDMVNFLKVVRHWLFNNPALVEPDEADRRAAICATCIHNVDAVGCFGCTNIAGMIFDVVKDRATPHDEQLKNCQVCGCVNRAQVWVPKDTLDQGVSDRMRGEFPAHCWKK